jgi:hypothetical protein
VKPVTTRDALFVCLLFADVRLEATPLVGQRLKVTGYWKGDHVEVTRVQPRGGDKDPSTGRVEGHIEEVLRGGRAFRVGPIFVDWDDSTGLDGLSAADLSPGRGVEVIGKVTAPGRLSATAIAAETLERGVVQLLGTVTEANKRSDGASQWTMIGVPMVAAASFYSHARELARNPNDKRPEDQRAVSLFNRPLTLGGELGSTSRYDGRFDLGEDRRPHEARAEPALELEAFYPASDRVSVFLQASGSVVAWSRQEETERREMKRGESWVLLENLQPNGLGLQIGRQNFRDAREWWWDEDLDAIRVHYFGSRVRGELAVAQELAPASSLDDGIDRRQEGVRRWLGQVGWQWFSNQRLEGFFLDQSDRSSRPALGQIIRSADEDKEDADLLWLGGRVSGTWTLGRLGQIDYRLDGATVRGQETLFRFKDAGENGRRVSGVSDLDVAGWAWDGGLTWRTPLPGNVAFTVGRAVGSGDRDPRDGRDESFRQTGLHDNNARFRGVDRFRYYGELLRPELSNLKISTLAVGFRLLPSSSLELLYHDYRQVHPADFLRDARLKADPDGRAVHVGREWNLVLGLEESRHVEIELVAGLFRAGRAYGDLRGQNAFNLILKADLNF